MNDTSVATQQLHLERLFERIHFWFHEPDPMAIRATLAVTAALSLDTHPLWLMLVGASSIGKTAIHFPLAQAHPRCFTPSDVTIAGLLSMGKGSKDKGILREVGVKGLWLIKDFSAILGMHDDQR